MAEPATNRPPKDYRILYEGIPLPPFYAAEMLRPHIGKTVWLKDDAERTRHGILKEVPWVKEDQETDLPAIAFENDRMIYPRGIVLIALYQPPQPQRPRDAVTCLSHVLPWRGWDSNPRPAGYGVGPSSVEGSQPGRLPAMARRRVGWAISIRRRC